MESSDEETLSERSYVSERSERSLRSERSGGSLSPCPSGLQGPSGDTLPWNRPSRHERGERRKRKTHNSVLDPAERAVVRVADERDRVQKKTFMKWVNKHLIKVRKHITDLYEDLRDGHNLISLLEVLSGVTLPREKGRMRFHRLQNVQIALDFLKQRQVKLVNIRNDDITDGNPKLTLGLIWTIILHFQISEIYVSGESGDLTAKEKLLLWSQQASEGWPGLRCTNFSSSWSDGRMFNALLHRFRPDLIDMEVVAQQSNLDNLEQAFEIAESLGVTRLLDAEDVDVPSPDEKSVITYVSSIYDAFPKIPEGGEGIAAHEVDHRWAEYRSRFSTLLQWSRQHKAIMANKNFPLDPVELKALYNEYVHFKETEIPAKELEKSRVEHLYKLLEVWMEFGRIKLPLGLHPNDLEEEWGKLILEMLEREKALRPAVERLELLLQMANKIQNMALDCEEKLTLAKNTLQADMSLVESGEAVCCERELGLYLQDCEVLIRQLNLDLNILRDEKYYQVEQLAFRASCLHEELVSLRLQCSSVYRKGHFSPVTGGDRTAPRGSDSGLSLSTGAQTLLGAVGVVGVMGAALLRRPMSRSQLVAMSSSEDEGSLRFVYELLGWVEETQDVLERAEWGADLPSVEQNLQDHQNIHTAVEELLHSLKEARNYQTKVSPNFKSSYSDTLAKLEHLYCKLLELSSWRLRCLESLHAFVCRCTEELIWLNEREEEELAYDWSQNNTNVNTKRELYAEMRSELEEKQEVMHSLQETADRLCQENHPAKQTVEAYSAALQTQWQWVRQLCVCVEQHLKDNTTYFQFVSDARDCETYLRQLQDTIKRQYTCDKNSRLGKLEDLLQDSMEEKEQLIEYRSSVASLVGRAKTVVQLRPRSAESTLGSTTPIRAICDYRQIEITISRGEECVLGDNSQRTKWKVISPSGNEAMVPSVCFTVPPPNQEAMDTASRMEQLYQNVMSLWHNLHVSMKSVVSWHYLQKDIRTVSSWSLDTVRSQPPVARDQALDHLEAHLADFLSDSKESALFTPTERHELERDAHTAQEHCQDLLVNMETVEKDESVSRSYLSELQNIKLRLEEAEQRLMRGIQTPPPSNRSGDGVDNTVQIAEQEKLQSDLDGLRTSLGEVSRRCGSFFEEKPASSSVPVLRSELNLAVEKIDRLHNLSSVYLHKLKTVDVLMYSLQAAESQVKRYENRLSEEDIVPVDTNAIQALREQLGTWQSELEDQEGVFNSLQSAVQKAREAGSQLNRLHPDRSPELERYQERAAQLTERWAGVKRQMETRRGELEALGSVLQQYRDGHSALIHWIEETTERQENTQPGQTDSKVLSEQLAQQTALVADIEKNQTKLDECQTHSKQYCTSVKDYELQLMTFRAFVESTQKSTGKRRRMHSSSDTITQEFMDLRTRYTALVTLTTQHVKYISDALRRLEEEEKEVEEERQQRVGQVSELLGWVKGLQGRAGDPSAVSEQLAAKKEEVAKVIRNTQVFLMSKQASKLSPEERAQVTSQMDELTATYSQLCDSSTAQLQQLVQQQAKEEQRKVEWMEGGREGDGGVHREVKGEKDEMSSLRRQECLERDQQIVALLSMVRHIEVRVKQQQQQSIGRSLIALDDIIKQTDTLDLELRDLEPQVNKAVDAAEQLLEPRPQEVPPQLLLALEKDGRSLARGYKAARGVSENILQGLRSHRDAYTEALTGEQKSLGGRVEDLLSWLKETEAQITGMDGQTQGETPAQLTQQLQLCKELQSSLSARSNDVNTVAFDIQVFISERAQDLAPEQSRHLLGQLQQLQRGFHRASGQAHAKTDALAAQREREEERQRRREEKEEEEKERERERESAREREVVQQQKAECSQKLEGLTMWLAGAASMLANQAGAESGDVNVLQQKQRELKEVQKDLLTRGDGVAETIRSVEEFLAEHGDSLSPEERANLQGALSRMKEQYSALTDTAQSSLVQLDTAISTTVQQNTQRAKAVEELQETRGQMDSLLEELSSLNQPGMTVTDHLSLSSSTSPEGGLQSHSDMLQAELQQLQAQQAQLMQVSQNARSLLDQPDSAVPAEEKRRLRDQLDQLQTQHQEKLRSCQERLRRSEALKDELAKFLQEHGGLGTWLEQSEGELCSLGEGETDAQGLKGRLEEHKKLAEDVICHKADLRFVSISGQKVLDSVQGALEKVGGSDPALEETKQLVTDKLQDANHRYIALHTKSSDLGGRLSGLLERYQQYQDEAVSLHTWLSAQEQNQSIAGPSGETDTQTLQNTLRAVQLLQDELAERSVQLEKVRRSGRELANTQESPTLRAAEITSTADGLEKRFSSLSESMSERAEQLQTSVAQSVSVQEGLKGLLAWLDGLLLTPGPIQPTAQAVQDALTQNQKLRQELLSRQGSVEATCDSVSKLLQSSDASTASGLQGSLESLTQSYAAAQAKQAEREAELRGLLPKLENYERLSTDLQGFTQTCLRALSPAGQPDRSVEDYRQTIEEVRAEQEQEAGHLKSFCQLGTDLSQAKALTSTQTLLDNVREVSDEFARLESNINERYNAIQSCEQQSGQFRSLSGSLLRWLQATQEQLPLKEPNVNTEALQRRVQQLKDLLSDWEAQGVRVLELNKTGSELETLIINITAPQTKTGVPQVNGAGSPGSVNGIHTCKDLTELQVAVAEVNGRYEELGEELKDRQWRQEASLELRQKARQSTEELSRWLGDRENSLHLGQTAASPSKPEVVRAQAQENKALLSELAEHSGKVKELKSTLEKLIADNPDSPEADTWRQQMKEIDSRWEKANEAAVQRQVELETCADRLGSFATAASQLGPWLKEKELMMSVLGPLSIDPNMLNTQNQQVQFMLREFDTRRPQFDQLTQAAEGILSPSGGDSSPQDAKDLAEVRSELGSISQQWDDLTQRLSRRSEHIDQAQGTSERYQALLKNLSVNVGALGERLDSQASLSAQPEALKRRLQETGEIRSELEQRREELGEAEKLCGELSAIVVEPYLRDELKKRLESVSSPLRSLEERAADGLSQLQAALSSTQQFQQMFEELRSWLDNQSGQRDSTADSLPCQSEAIRTLLAQQDELHRGVASQRGPYELIQAEGASLLASLPAGGEERSALLSRLTDLRRDWDELNQCITERQNRLKSTLTKAESYQQHRAELTPWVAECEEREADIQLSLDPAALDEALQKARQLGLDLERRRPLLEALNIAADQLLEHCRVGEEDVRDEKAQLNRRVDGLAENLQNRVSQLEELAGRLKEFEDGRQAVERRLEAARHQIEVQDALGPQACSNKSLERLRSQQETLHSLQPQVAYLRDLAQGLVQDAPHTAGGGGEGGQRLEQQARDTDREFGDVSEKIEKCCSTLETRLQGVGEVQSSVRDLFSHLADLDDELDSLSPVGRDADSLASQADAVHAFLARLATLRSELEGHGGDCTAMLRREGSSPDLLALRRETEALSRQAGKLSERGQARMGQIEVAAEKVGEFYAKVAELQGLLRRAEEGLNAQGVVGTEVETIKQQLHEFKAVEREQVDSIQPKLQRVNAVGQGLIQSAAKHTDTQALEHDLETTNLRWNSLNKRVAERIAQLQEALLHCGKFQDALEPLLSWLSDTEELVANQKPPSAEYRVVKAQIQEQKLLQRLLDDRRATFQMIQGEGERIAATAETQDRDKIQKQLESLGERWGELLEKARARQCQLEELQTLALQFHEAVEPLGEWLSATERRLSTAEPMGTQTSKITQQITKHKAVQEAVSSRGAEVDRLQALGQSLAPLSCAADRDWLGERVGAVRLGHSELSDWCQRRAVMLEQALANAQLFGEDEVEVLNWLAEVGQRLGQVSVQSYQPGVLTQQHKHTLSLNEEIVSRKKQVDQAIKNGQALLKQTTGEEVLLIQEKLDGIKSRYAEMTGGSSKALRTLEQALQLSTRFASAHDDLNQWLDKVEAELNVMEPDATPAYQDRQKELKCVSAEKRLVLDTVNEVGNALLDLVPWRAREGLDRLVADANQRYRTAAETITQRVKLVQAAIQRSQQYEEAVDAELTWAGETDRKLSSLGPLSLEPDVTVAQLQVQRAFNIDIIRHKDTVDQLLHTRDDILETCSDQQRDALVKTDSLSARYEAVSQQHQERFSALEQAQVLVARFWETQEDLEPWLGETETLIAQLPPPAIDTEALRLQQEQMRLLRESIAEHKPHIDKLLKIGPQLAALSHQEGATVRKRYSDAEKRYVAIKEVVKGRATTLDEAVSQSAQFHDKMDPLLETLEGAVQRLRSPPPVAAEADKIREQLADHKATGLELDKLLPSFSALCARGEELISRAAHDDPAAQAVRSRLLRLRSLWDEIRQRAEEREGKLTDVLDLAGKFWADMAALLSTLRDSQDIVRELEDPGVDPSLIKQQIEAAEAIKAETDGLREELEFVRTLGADLIFACGETEKPEVKKTIDEMNAAWEGLNRTWRERMERLEEAMTASVQYQDALQSMFDYLDNAVIKLCDMSTVGTDLGTVKQQIEELKQYKVEVYQQQIDMEKLCHQGELLLKKVSDQTDRDMIQEPITELRHLWDNLGDKITHRQHKLEGALLALGQFQHALSELQSWLSHTHATLDTQRPINSDPKAIEIELAKHHVLRNDVLSHRSTVETVNTAGAELLESSPGDEANHLRDQLDHLNRGWENLLLKTQDRQKLLEAALHQAEGFHGELEEFLQWLRRTESQLSAAKPTGGLPETAREQLQQHLELQTQLAQRAEQYNRLLDAGESMLLSRGGEEGGPGAGTTQTQQNLTLLQSKWASLNTKMDDRRAKLDEAVSLATGFQSSLQDTINWLTQAEQTLNMAQPPSLILDTVLFQIDEHKVFVNEVNTHREQVLALEKAGSQLRFASIKQDVVLIKNLLLSVQARWDKLVQRSLDRGRHLDEARKRAKQFHEAWRKLSDWLEEAESRLDSELEISNEPDKIKVQLTKHKEFQKALGSKQPVYDTTVRSGKAMRDKAMLPEDTQKLDHLLGEVRDKWDTVCGKSVERQHKLEEALLFSGQFAEALQALVDWLYRVEPQLAEDLPVHGDLDLVSNLMDSHKAFQKELGKRTTSVHALKRSARELMETGRDDTAWVKVQLQELSNRWDTVCALSVTKQTRLQQALKQAEEFRTAVQLLLEWLSEAEQTLRFRGVLPEEAETLQALLHTHRNFMATVEEKRTDVNRAAGQGEAILTACQADCITTIKHWITIIRARFEEVLTWAKQHEQRLETALTELLNNATLLEELLSWLQWAETTLVQRDGETLPQDIPQLKTLITEHQVFMEEMTRKQPDVDKVTKTYKRKPAEPPSSLAERRGARKNQQQQQHQQAAMQVAGGNPRLTQLCSRWQQVWLLALDRQRKLNDALDRLEELKEFASFDFDVWRKKYMRWMNHKKSRVMDFFRRIDKDQDGKITRQEFIDGILASKFPTSRLEMTAVADIFDQDGDGYIDYYEFVAALHPNKDAYRPTTDADKIEDEVTRQVAQCKCAKRFQVEQIGENKYRFFLGNQFGDSQQLRLVRILRSTVMVRVGGGWMALDEFLVKNDPCRARGRTNLELREKFILPEGASQGLAAFRSRGRRSKPGSRTASPTRSSSSASHSAHSCASLPSTPATPTASSRVSSSNSRGYAKPWLAHSKTPTPTKCQSCPDHDHTTPGHEGAVSGSKLKRPTFHSSRGSLTGENGGATPTSTKPGRTGKAKVLIFHSSFNSHFQLNIFFLSIHFLSLITYPPPFSLSSPLLSDPSRAGSRAGSRASSRRGSDASDASELLETRSACSDTSDTPRRPGAAKPSKIPTISKKAPSPKTPTSGKK
uniref:Microtubule actin crosslinking factor 1 n=1 Tax=Salmo trutta TaxID=8032 RepID=A0A674F3G2_SALTR